MLVKSITVLEEMQTLANHFHPVHLSLTKTSLCCTKTYMGWGLSAGVDTVEEIFFKKQTCKSTWTLVSLSIFQGTNDRFLLGYLLSLKCNILVILSSITHVVSFH